MNLAEPPALWQRRVGLTDTEIAGVLGVHRVTWNGWKNHPDRAPVWLSFALYGVEKSQPQS